MSTGKERDPETDTADGNGSHEAAAAGTDVVAGGGYPETCDTPARKLLYDMVSIPSPSGEEEQAAKRLVDFFQANGREAWLDEVGNVRAPASDSVLLTSHIDTVPGDIPVEVKPADGDNVGDPGEPVLWGRGSVDATGSLVAMAVAAVKTGVSFVGVVGEETSSRGARFLVADRDAPEMVVNGEPSGWDGITLGYRGFLAGTYVNTSESGHTSRPEPNAIQHAIDWWHDVEETFELTDPETPVFEQVTAKPVSVDGGLTEDGLAVETTMEVQLRVPPNRTVDEIHELAEAQMTTGSVHWKEPIPPVMESPRTELARAFRVAIREAGGDVRLIRKTGTSDMNLFAAAWDCPMVTYGPGDSDLDHAPDERLPLSHVDRATTVLSDVCRDRP